MTGGVIVTKESDEVGGILLMICTITVTRNLQRERTAGPSVAAALEFIGGATDRRSSARS